MNINMELTTWNLDQNETRKDLKRTTRINKINKEPRNKEGTKNYDRNIGTINKIDKKNNFM